MFAPPMIAQCLLVDEFLSTQIARHRIFDLWFATTFNFWLYIVFVKYPKVSSQVKTGSE
jgi:hypothetical protein